MTDMLLMMGAITLVGGFIGVMLVLEGDNWFAKMLGFLLVAGMGALVYTSGVIAFGPQRLTVDHAKCEAYAWQEVDRKWICLNGDQ